MTAKWQAGHTYAPGALVVPISKPKPPAAKLTDPNFEDGGAAWDLTGGLAILNKAVQPDMVYSGVHSVWLQNDSGDGDALNPAHILVNPGDTIAAHCQINQGHASAGDASGYIFIRWFTGNDIQVGNDTQGNVVVENDDQWWLPSRVSGQAPAGAVYARIGVHLANITTDPIAADAFVLDEYDYSGVPASLAYKAVQSASAKSGTTEPDWPLTLGDTVVDGGVTWEAVIATQVVWQASPLMQSGATEPVWPTAAGATVRDGMIDWTAETFRVTDKHCPQTKIVAIASSKVFAADDDVIRFCATVNPLDWSAEADAGFLPFGLQTYGANPAAAMNLYRSNLVVFNAEGMQMWQVDEDPANMALLDALPIPSTAPKALAPVANDTLFLTPEGVRTIGIAGGSVNLEAGEGGKPIDPLIVAALKGGITPRATYYPGAGQYWLAFGAEVYVYTAGKPHGWSRYTFPFAITQFCQLGDDLYLRAGDDLLKVDDSVIADYVGDARETPFDGVVQWPWLSFGSPATKRLTGFDVVADGVPTVEMGYDETDKAAFTEAFDVPGDTLPGQVIPLPVMAASLSPKITFKGVNQTQPFRLQAMTLYFNDMRIM